jgi:hypothetical protein
MLRPTNLMVIRKLLLDCRLSETKAAALAWCEKCSTQEISIILVIFFWKFRLHSKHAVLGNYFDFSFSRQTRTICEDDDRRIFALDVEDELQYWTWMKCKWIIQHVPKSLVLDTNPSISFLTREDTCIT